jgi:hypothetical protein
MMDVDGSFAGCQGGLRPCRRTAYFFQAQT